MKKLIAIIVLPIAAFLWTFRAAPLDNPPPFEGALPAATPPPEMSIELFDTGKIESRAALAYQGGAFSELRDFSMIAVLIHHPRGNLLVDTGFGRNLEAHVQMQPWIARQTSQAFAGVPLIDQMRARAQDPTALAGVILTHSHWDHVSGLPDLPGIPVLINAEERAFIANGGAKSQHLRSFSDVKYQEYAFDGPSYLGFARSHDVWGDGSIVLVHAPGHTPGSVIVFVTLPSGKRFALLGDLVWQREGIEERAQRPWLARTVIDDDVALVRQGITQVAALRRRFADIQWVPAHDPRAFLTLPTR